MSEESIRKEKDFGAHNYHPLPVVWAKAKGVHVWDPEGRKYYDFLSAYSSANQGHSHPRIINALCKQAETLCLSSRAFYNNVLGGYEEFLTEYFGYDMVLPMNTGAEAVETAVKLARKWAYKVKGVPLNKAIILSCENNFHGRTMTAVSLSTDPQCRNDFGPYLPNVGAICAADAQRKIRFGSTDALEEALKAHGDHAAAFLVEPIQGEAGVIVPHEKYLSDCARLCKQYNVLLIADEIQSGLGRTGKMLASEHWGVRPDVVILGKALSGGCYPVSAVLADKPIMLCIKPGEHGSTYGGNPLGSAVAMESLKVLRDEKLAENAQLLGTHFRSSLMKLNAAIVKEVRGKGLFNAIEMDAVAMNGKTAWDLCLLLKKYGILTKPTHETTIRLSPPLCITKEQIDECVGIIGRALNEIASWNLVENPLE